MSAHTPRPWAAVKEWGNRAIVSGNGVEVAIVALPEDGDLIAAAPDLLAALEGLTCYELFRRLPDDFRDRVHSAITKARGTP